MNSLLIYCRSGFEVDLAGEVEHKSASLALYGYSQFSKNSGYVLFHFQQPQDAELFVSQCPLSTLIFARQWFICVAEYNDLDPQDRVSTLLEESQLPLCGELRVEHPDNTDGRELSKFCRKFTVPLRQAMRKRNLLTQKEQRNRPIAMVFFATSTHAFIGFAIKANCSNYPLGILRLKFPANAPSRSTLKLDEAFQLFIPASEHEHRLKPGLHAVDLGACPGGWTYQLVNRGMFVQAIDNGAMDETLMETGQVSYFAEDGFKYKPKKKNVYWLVCDMIEQPQKVAKLMANWVASGMCKEAMFNLKLPMKKRFDSVADCFSVIDSVMKKSSLQYQIQAKHLYHDREEITVHLRLA